MVPCGEGRGTYGGVGNGRWGACTVREGGEDVVVFPAVVDLGSCYGSSVSVSFRWLRKPPDHCWAAVGSLGWDGCAVSAGCEFVVLVAAVLVLGVLDGALVGVSAWRHRKASNNSWVPVSGLRFLLCELVFRSCSFR